jgi:predicted DNA-binding WGR domain protein
MSYLFDNHNPSECEIRLELKNDISNKFYEIYLKMTQAGSSFTTGSNKETLYAVTCKWGRIGTPNPREKLCFENSTLSQAWSAAKSIYLKKRGKGYTITSKDFGAHGSSRIDRSRFTDLLY